MRWTQGGSRALVAPTKASSRTAKSCGPDPRRWDQVCGWRVRRRWRLSSPALQGEREAAVKTIAQGMPVEAADPVV